LMMSLLTLIPDYIINNIGFSKRGYNFTPISRSAI